VLNLVSAKLWWIVGCSLSAFLPGSAPAAQESTPARAAEEVNAPWDDLLSVVRKPVGGDQLNRAPQGIEQPDNSPAPAFQPSTLPDHGKLDRSGAVAPAVAAPPAIPKRQRVREEKTSRQSAQSTRPRREMTARVPKIENHRGRERQASSSPSPGGASAASTQSPRLKRNRTNAPEVSAAVAPEFPRSLLPSSATR
jgi:hypothetical protein